MANVLLIEDSPLVIQMLTMVCEDAGHQVTSADTFDDAKTQLAHKRPDIIVTDLNLPDIPDGDTLDALRAIEGLDNTPIIIVSGRPRDELDTLAAESGAQGALSKDDGMPAISGELPDLITDLTAQNGD